MAACQRVIWLLKTSKTMFEKTIPKFQRWSSRWRSGRWLGGCWFTQIVVYSSGTASGRTLPNLGQKGLHEEEEEDKQTSKVRKDGFKPSCDG
jgi:hypothetical protein